MSACPTCGAERGAIARRGGLSVCDAPPRAQWKGERMELTVLQARILWLFARWGEVRRETLERIAVGENAGPDVLATQICKLRRRIAPLGLEISAVRGWGYRLSLPEECAS